LHIRLTSPGYFSVHSLETAEIESAGHELVRKAEAQMRERAANIVDDARGESFYLRSLRDNIRALKLTGDKP
jgi:hypothetical protein